MGEWNIRTYTTDDGSKPVDDWILRLPPRAAARVVAVIDLLERHGIDLHMPHAKHLEDGVWELRARLGSDIWRVLYFHWKGRTFGLLHSFTKKAQQTSRADIDVAKVRRETWLRRERDRRGAA